MEMTRTWLRRWLGISQTEARVVLLQNEVDGFRQMAAQVLAAQSEVNRRVKELNELKEEIRDPKRVPVVARSMRQFKALMEQD